jgi:C_GCAxxG_C_C family probable redox protein
MRRPQGAKEELAMDITRIEKKAKERFGANGLFCAESVLTAVSDEAMIVSSLIPRIATGFCGGFARTRGTCGAVTGGIMALGILYGRDNANQSYAPVYDKEQQFLRAFEKEYSSINCFELTGFDLSKKEERQVFAEKGMMKTCRQFTGGAARLVAELIR